MSRANDLLEKESPSERALGIISLALEDYSKGKKMSVKDKGKNLLLSFGDYQFEISVKEL